MTENQNWMVLILGPADSSALKTGMILKSLHGTFPAVVTSSTDVG